MRLGATPTFLLVVNMAMLNVACVADKADPSASETSPTPSAPAGRDVADLDVCALVPGAEVAALFDGTLAGEPHGAIYPGASTECSYAIQAGGRNQVALVFLYPASQSELFGTEEEEKQEIKGLGDRAYATTGGGIAEVHVLLEDGMSVDARADTVDQARRLAELTMSKL